MKISERTVKRVAEIITGDKGLSPYRTGPQLVRFFNEFGTNYVYGQGFPARWSFAEECIRRFNDTPTLKNGADRKVPNEARPTRLRWGDHECPVIGRGCPIVLSAIEKEFDSNAPDHDGNLPKLYKRVQKHLNLSPENPNISDSLKQTLTGFISIIGGLSGLSNKMGDRHVREYKPAEHHAVLIVNAAMTFSNFIFDTYAYQQPQKS